MLEALEKVMAFVIDTENDDSFDIALEMEYNFEEDMFYIFHNVKNNEFDQDTTFKLNTKLIKYLDSNGIYNYGFGYSAHLFGEEERVKQNFSKKKTDSKFDATNFSFSTRSSKDKQLSLVA